MTLTLRQARPCSWRLAAERQWKEPFKALEFATLAGVTAHAWHHYDRLGLLKPKQRSGYRLYSQRDLGRLEQIVVLKFLGMPLKQIQS